MLWIKRNLVLVIGIAVSLLLLGGAAYYLYNNELEDFARDGELEQMKVKLDQLSTGIFPSEDNIAAVRSNVVQVLQFSTEAERMLAQEPVKAGTQRFSVLLPRVLDELLRDATNAAVELPPKYKFTFGEVMGMPSIPSYGLEPLGSRLAEIKTICEVLFKARVRGIESLQRVAAFADEPKGPDLLLDRAEQTNSLAPGVNVTVTPYRVVFRGFSGDLSTVLNTLSSTKEFFVVRQVDVESATPGIGGAGLMNQGIMNPGMMTPGAFGAPGPGAPPGMSTPGLAPMGPPGGVRPGVPKGLGGVGTAPPVPKSSLTKILDEHPLRISLVLDVIKVSRKAVAPTPPTPPPTN